MQVKRLEDPDYERRVRELLDRLEEVEPRLQRSARELWMTKFRNVMAFVSAAAFILAGIAILRVGVIDRHVAAEAAAQANASKRASDCINTVLGVRSTTTTQETKARKDYAIAQKAFAQGQTDAFRLIVQQGEKNNAILASTKSPEELQKAIQKIVNTPNPGVAKLLSVEDTFTEASNSFIGQLTSIEVFRKAHPLGKC